MSSRRAPFVVVVAVALIAHAASLIDGFVFDDTSAITANPLVQAPSPWPHLLTADFWGRQGSAVGPRTWRPLVTLDFWIDQHAGNGRPVIFHAGNLVWHALAALMLALALARVTRRIRFACVAASIFAVLAVDGEAVASLVGRADVMAAAFAFATWSLWRRRPAAAAATFFCALVCKESALVWPVFLVAAERLAAPDDPAAPSPDDPAPPSPTTKLRRSPLVQYALAAVAAAVYLAGRAHAVGGAFAAHVSANNNPLVEASLPVRVWTSMRLLLLALRLILLPLNSSADYSAAELMPDRRFAVEPLIGLVALVLIVAAAIAWRRQRPLLALAATLFLVAWLPVSNALVALPTIFAERLLYLPAAGAALAMAVLLDGAWRQRRALACVAGGILVAGNLALDVAADRMWHDELRLFATTVEVSPRSARAWINYGAALQARGQREAALAAYARSLEVYPTWKAESSLGVVLDELGRPSAAEPHLRKAALVAPGEVDAIHNLALFLARHGAHAEAAALLRPMVAAHPEAGGDARLLQQLDLDLARRNLTP